MSRANHSVILVILLSATLILGCAATGPGGKKSLIFIGSDTEISIGSEMDTQIRSEYKILDDTLWQNYVSDIGQRIVNHCDRKDIEYHFMVIDSNMVNAFAAPGGYIYLYTGLLKVMENEAECSAVIAHEISHVVARHGIKRLQASIGVSLLQELLLGESAEALKSAVNIGLGLTFASYSRSNENEADRYGIQYMIKAGYHPDAAISMFEKLASMSDGSPNFFERMTMSHPETIERISNSRELIESLKPLPRELELFSSRYQTMVMRLP